MWYGGKPYHIIIPAGGWYIIAVFAGLCLKELVSKMSDCKIRMS
jgi:hypothetical protein